MKLGDSCDVLSPPPVRAEVMTAAQSCETMSGNQRVVGNLTLAACRLLIISKKAYRTGNKSLTLLDDAGSNIFDAALTLQGALIRSLSGQMTNL